MELETLQKANEIQDKIKKLEKKIDILENDHYFGRNSVNNCNNSWIEFRYGNGNSSEPVCDDSDLMKEVRDLILMELIRQRNGLRLDLRDL